MGKQSLPLLTDVQMETEDFVGMKLLQKFQLTFRVGGKSGNEETERIAAWVKIERKSHNVDFRTLWRHVQHYRPGQSAPEANDPIMLADSFGTSDDSFLLKELLYLWTRDYPADERVKPLLQQNLKDLRTREDRDHQRDAFASATVYMYDHAEGEVLRYMAIVSTRPALRQAILELPTDCTMVEIHLQIAGQIIGNAEYQIANDLVHGTGKRRSIFSAEYGSCKGMLDAFADLYEQVDPTVEELMSEE